MNNKSAFTLVEIMIVVSIIGLLAAIAFPSFMKARATAVQNACINNLRLIDGSKEQAALSQRWGPGADCTGLANRNIVNAYMKGGEKTCPGDATITYNFSTVGENPKCTYTGTDNTHVLPL